MDTLCISKSWLRQKSQELGIKDSAIETIVHEYINQQGNDNFPTDDYIKQQFVPKSQIVDDKDYYDNLMKDAEPEEQRVLKLRYDRYNKFRK